MTERRLRLAVVTPYYKPRIGGLERYAHRIAEDMRDRAEVEVVVITSRPGLRTRVDHVDGIPVIRMGAWAVLSNTPVSPLWPWTLRRLFREHRIDVVNAHAPVPYMAECASLSANGRPMILTYHAGSLLKGRALPDLVLAAYERVVLPWLFRRSAALIAVSPVSKAHLTGRAVMIPPGVDVDVFVPGTARTPERPVLLYVGRLERSSAWKGVDVLIEAMAKIRVAVPDAVLELVGEGDAIGDLVEQAHRLGIGDAVVARGQQSGPELVGSYQGASVVVLPSRTEAESFGMVLVEAMSCGVPVVASRVGGIPFVVRDGIDGLLVTPGDPAELADACVRVLTDREFARCASAAGRTAAQQRFSWRKSLASTAELIASVAAAADARTSADVVHVVAYYPPHVGGMEKSVEQLMRVLPQYGVTPSVITSDVGAGPDEGTPSEGPSLHDISVTRLPSVEFAHTPIMPGLLKALLNSPCDAVMHVHVAQALIPDLAALVARRRGQPVVAHYHLDTDPSGPLGLLLKPYQRTILRRTMRAADAVVVPTRDYAHLVERSFGLDQARIHVIPSGTDFPLAETPRQAPDGAWRLMSVGRLTDQKNFPALMRACAHLAVEHPDLTWTLDVFGDGEQRPMVQAEIDRLRLHDRVTLRGAGLDREQLLAEYDRADLFVLASRKESFGIVFVEAMARGVPVVTTNVPGVRNVVTDGRNGRLVSSDAATLAAAMAEVMHDRDRYRELSVNCLTDAGQYSWSAVGAQMTQLYRDCRARGARQTTDGQLG